MKNVVKTGNLHFSYLTMSDMQNNRLYKCNVRNLYLDLVRGVSYTRLQIAPGTYAFSASFCTVTLLT